MENKSPEGVVIPVEADDFDDHQWNGPPYTFALDPDAPAELHSMFSVTTVGKWNLTQNGRVLSERSRVRISVKAVGF